MIIRNEQPLVSPVEEADALAGRDFDAERKADEDFRRNTDPRQEDVAETHSFTDLGNVRCHIKNGTYIITDPCYVFPDKMWSDLCNKIFCREDNMGDGKKECPDTGVIEMDGHQIWWGQTAHGDGGYKVKKFGAWCGEFGVDAGLFAIFPIEFVKKYAPDMMAASNQSTTLEMSGEVDYEGGNMHCGAVSVDTAGRYESDDEDDEDDGDDK